MPLQPDRGRFKVSEVDMGCGASTSASANGQGPPPLAGSASLKNLQAGGFDMQIGNHRDERAVSPAKTPSASARIPFLSSFATSSAALCAWK